MTAPAPTDAYAAARERFTLAALWWFADQSCSHAYAEFEDAYAALEPLMAARLANALRRRRAPPSPSEA